MTEKREMLRHTVATAAYRAAKTVRDVPAGFGGFRAGSTGRTPVEILAHVGDLFEWALALSKGLDRDRAVDETGGQIAVFGRLGSRPCPPCS